MLKLPTKASQIANLTDARYFAAREVAWLGFNLDAGTENAISPQQVNAIKEWVEGPKIVAEFGLQDADEIKMVTDYIKVDAIQISMFADTAAIHNALNVPIIKEVIIENESLSGVAALVQAQASIVDIFLFDLTKNHLHWNQLPADSIALLKDLCADHKILFNLDSPLEILPDFIEQINPHGLVLLGGEEEKVGYKSFDELDDILDFLEIEE